MSASPLPRLLLGLGLLAACAADGAARYAGPAPEGVGREERARRREWLRGQSAALLRWADVAEPESARTPPYAALVLAFGLARVGDGEQSRDMLGRARKALKGEDAAHRALLAGYEYRITEALAGRPHAGPLPAAQLGGLALMERLPRYIVDRLRKHSRVLEPDRRVNPYRHWGARINDFEKALAELPDMAEGKEAARRIGRLLAAEPGERRARVYRAGLEEAPRVGDAFAGRMLKGAIASLDAGAVTADQAALLESAMVTAAYFGRAEELAALSARLRKALHDGKGKAALFLLEPAAARCAAGVRKLGLRDEARRLAAALHQAVLRGRDVKDIDFRKEEGGPVVLRLLLHAASCEHLLGRPGKAEPILDAARRALLEGKPLPAREATLLACTYARAAGHAPLPAAHKRLAELLRALPGIRDTYTTTTHFSVSRLDVIEAIVFAAVGED
jgi:hypothetical protein